MTGAWEPISCSKYEELRANPAMRAHSACTNYVGGEVLLEIANRGEAT